MNSILEISGLRKSYGPLEVIKGVDLSMKPGEVVSIIGSSGSGKTTLLRCINLLEEFQGGDIRIDGQLIGYKTSNGKRISLPERERAKNRALTGMAFQQFNLFPHMTALGNVRSGWSAWACPSARTTIRSSFPADSSSAWPLPGRSP